MKVKELVESLSKWPEDSEVEFKLLESMGFTKLNIIQLDKKFFKLEGFFPDSKVVQLILTDREV